MAAEKPDLVLVWQESGGPIVKPPTRQGFGSRMIERGLAMEFGGETAWREFAAIANERLANDDSHCGFANMSSKVVDLPKPPDLLMNITLFASSSTLETGRPEATSPNMRSCD